MTLEVRQYQEEAHWMCFVSTTANRAVIGPSYLAADLDLMANVESLCHLRSVYIYDCDDKCNSADRLHAGNTETCHSRTTVEKTMARANRVEEL